MVEKSNDKTNTKINRITQHTEAANGFSTQMRKEVETLKKRKAIEFPVHNMKFKEGNEGIVNHSSKSNIVNGGTMDELINVITVDKTNLTPSLSSVSGASPNVYTNANSGSFPCSFLWRQNKDDQTTLQRANKKRIDCFVKGQLFKVFKFIPSGHMMLFQLKKKSICQLVCNALSILPDEQQSWWETYFRCVERSINLARNDAIAAVKKSFFKGKNQFCL